MAREEVLRSGEVTLEQGDKIYTARYDVLKGGVVRLETGSATQRRGLTEEQLARQLLREVIESGLADQRGLGRPKK
jgi:hypothetical protein